MSRPDPTALLGQRDDLPPLLVDFQELNSREYAGEDPTRLAKVTLDGTGLVIGVTLAPEVVRRTSQQVAAAVREALNTARGTRIKALADMGARHGIAPGEEPR